ncbi:MAG: HEAT repeat domain-containing protein [Phycisphaerae bacterium]|nr:HEAT repeat domain-containing protein [Phycisphaerae bacterium]
MRRFASIGALAGILWGVSFGQADMGQQEETNPSLVGTSWEILYPLHPEMGLIIRSFEEVLVTDRGYPYSICWRVWWNEGRSFEIFSPSGEDSLIEGLSISGSFDQENMEGIQRYGRIILGWKGRKTEGQFDLDFRDPSKERTVIVQMLGYETCNHGNSQHLRERAVREPKNENEIVGRIFEIVSPEQYRGILIVTHYDFPISGYPRRMTQPDNYYYQRLYTEWKFQTSFGLCEAEVDAVPAPGRTIDEVTSALQQQLQDTHQDRRFHSVSWLANLDTADSRQVLLDSYWTHPDESTRARIAYVLSKYPRPDAEAIYLDVLEEDDSWMQWYAVEALGKIRSTAAVSAIRRIQQETRHWFLFYACEKALRILEGHELSDYCQSTLRQLRLAKQHKSLDSVGTAAFLTDNLDVVLPDVLDIYLEIPRRDYEPDHQYNSLTVLSCGGTGLKDLIQRCLADNDLYIQHKAMLLAKALHREWEHADTIETLHKNPVYDRFSISSRPLRVEVDWETTQRPKLPSIPLISQNIPSGTDGILGYPIPIRLFIEGRRIPLQNNDKDVLFEISKVDGNRLIRPIAVVLEGSVSIPENTPYIFEAVEGREWRYVDGVVCQNSPIDYDGWPRPPGMKKIFSVHPIQYYRQLLDLMKKPGQAPLEPCFADLNNDGTADTRFEADGNISALVGDRWILIVWDGEKAIVRGSSETIIVDKSELTWKIQK